MAKQADPEEKPERLYFKTYLQLVRNSVGSNMFRNFYVRTNSKGEFDALDDGYNSCAFYVSAVLVVFKKLGGVHGTVASTERDLRESGWQEVADLSDLKAGDVVIWEALTFADGPKQHIGFYMGGGKAVSTSWTAKTPVEHDKNFGKTNRKIERIFRMNDWS